MADILNKIIDNKHKELKATYFEGFRQKAEEATRPTISMLRALRSTPFGIIAEFKRKSPSKGWIAQDADPSKVVKGYHQAGAAACSILTDTTFFGGSLDDLIKARQAIPNIPLLRKEFIVSENQIYQARIAGADAILLIAACLTPQQCNEFAAIAHSINLEVLLEVHTEKELIYFNQHIDMLGVNNRNLGTFVTDIENSFKIARAMTNFNVPLISESGISDTAVIKKLQQAQYEGFLIGENFMKTNNPGQALKIFIEQLCS